MKSLHIRQELVTSFFYVVEDNGFPDADELLGAWDLDTSIITRDRLFDMSLSLMPYTSEIDYLNVNKFVNNLF